MAIHPNGRKSLIINPDDRVQIVFATMKTKGDFFIEEKVSINLIFMKIVIQCNGLNGIWIMDQYKSIPVNSKVRQ